MNVDQGDYQEQQNLSKSEKEATVTECENDINYVQTGSIELESIEIQHNIDGYKDNMSDQRDSEISEDVQYQKKAGGERMKQSPSKDSGNQSDIMSTQSGVQELAMEKVDFEIVEDMDSAFEDVGGFARHQWNMWTLQMLCMAMGSYALYPMGFYELQPVYECQDRDTGIWSKCTNINFCQNLMFDSDPKNATGYVLTQDKIPEYRVDWKNKASLYNWVEQFDLECAPKNEFGMFGSLFFMGVVISAFIMPRLSDIYGRKKIAISGSIGHFLSSLVILSSHSLNLSLTMTFMLGFMMGGRVLVGYCWMTEHMNSKNVPRVTALMFMCDSLGIFVSALYFRFVSKNWVYCFLAPQFLLFVAICGCFRQTESPKFFYSQKEYFRCRWALTLIGRTNGVIGPNDSYRKVFRQELAEKQNFGSKEQEDETSIKSFVSDPRNRKNGLIFMVMAVACNFVYYLINFYVKYLPGDIYTIQIVNSLAEAFSQLFPLCIGRYLSNKNGFAISYFGAGVACFAVMLAQIYNLESLIPICVIVTKAGISCAFCYLYFATVDYFPSQYLGLAMGFSNVVGRLSNVAAPMVAEQEPPLPMLTCIFICTCALVMCLMLESAPEKGKNESSLKM